MTVTEDAQFTAHPKRRPSRRLTVLIFLRKGYCLSHQVVAATLPVSLKGIRKV